MEKKVDAGNEDFDEREKTQEKESEKSTYQIVGTEETDMATGKISHQSPMGHAMLGKKVGEKFSFKTPKGNVNYVVVSIG